VNFFLGKHFLGKGNIPFRWGCVFLEQTRIYSGIWFTRHFIEFIVVETKQFVGSIVNVILTRQTCGQRSSRAARSKRRVLEYFFPSEFAMFPDFKMLRTLRSRSVHFVGTCINKTGSQWQLPGKKRVSPAGKIRIWHCAVFSLCKYPRSAHP